MKTIIPLRILFGIFMLNLIPLSANEFSSISLEGKYHIFIEVGNNNDCQSVYAFISPAENNHIKKSYQPESSFLRAKTTILENINPNKQLSTGRYQLDNGFAFFRSSDDVIYSSNASDETIFENLVSILNKESNSHSVYFYDYENNISFINALDVSCEGKIFSPKKPNNNGFFFLRKLKPSYGSHQNCYMIYYDFDSDYEIAKSEFKRLFSYIHLISDGCVQ